MRTTILNNNAVGLSLFVGLLLFMMGCFTSSELGGNKRLGNTKEKVIQGYMFGKSRKDPLKGGEIKLNGISAAVSDSTGHFSVIVPDSLQKGSVILQVKALGYTPFYDTIALKNLPLRKDFILAIPSSSIIIEAKSRAHRSPVVCSISREKWMQRRYSVNK